MDQKTTTTAKQRKHHTPQLRVVFDTNVLFTDSASDLVRLEAAKLIKESKFPDLEIQWYLPEMVRHERQYQMQKRALELLPPVAKVERLLGHNLAINEQLLIDSVEKVVSQRLEELGLVILALDANKVDWRNLALDAVYRRPPFKDGETEKGFRDRIIVECFLQLVRDSPKTPKICRIVLLSGDALVVQAVKVRTTESTNTAFLATIEELKGLINTLVSQVDEAFLALLRPKASSLFFVPKDETTLYYKNKIREAITLKFTKDLAALPPGATQRNNGKWLISQPNFARKTGRRVQWTSRINIQTEASKIVSYKSPTKTIPQYATAMSSLEPTSLEGIVSAKTQFANLVDVHVPVFSGGGVQLSSLSNINTLPYGSFLNSLVSTDSVTTHTGTDVYEVFWSVDVTTNRELRRPSIDEIRHGEQTWEQVT